MGISVQSEQVEQISASDAEAYAAGMSAALRVDTTAGASAVLRLVGQAMLAYMESRGLVSGPGRDSEQTRLAPIITSFCSGFFAVLDRSD